MDSPSTNSKPLLPNQNQSVQSAQNYPNLSAPSNENNQTSPPVQYQPQNQNLSNSQQYIYSQQNKPPPPPPPYNQPPGQYYQPLPNQQYQQGQPQLYSGQVPNQYYQQVMTDQQRYILEQQKLCCIYCKTLDTDRKKSVPGCITYGWGFCLFLTTGICCWIPFFLDDCKDTKIICNRCGGTKVTIQKTCC